MLNLIKLQYFKCHFGPDCLGYGTSSKLMENLYDVFLALTCRIVALMLLLALSQWPILSVLQSYL